ncbi:MAG: TadE/TadG family type IV pilus assembly protein, partial [Ilumatobacteraceae bacterium]
MSDPSTFAGRDRGESAVQYVVLIPIALFVVLLGIQAATYFHAANVASNAAHRAVSVASRAGSTAEAGVDEARNV